MDDAAPAAPATDFGAAQFHGVDTIALEAHVADGDVLTGGLLARRGLDDGGAGLAAEQQRGRVGLRVATDQQNLLAALGEVVGEVGQRKALADAALAIDGDDLGFLGHFTGVNGVRLGIGLFLQQGEDVGGVCFRLDLRFGVRVESKTFAHCFVLQSRTILRQAGSPNAVS